MKVPRPAIGAALAQVSGLERLRLYSQIVGADGPGAEA